MLRHISLSAVVLAALTVTACTTMSAKDGTEGVYRDSTTDLIDRAPSSMSLAREEKTTPTDVVNVRTQADYHFALAETYSLQGDSARATEEYKLTLVYDPKSPQVRARLAAEYVKQGLVSEALEQAKAAVEIDPKFIDGRLLLGGLYSALRMYEDALKEYRAILVSNPENLEAPLFIGALLAEQKKFAEASEQFEALGKASSNPQAHIAWYYLGRVKLEEDKEKNVSRAEAAFQQSLKSKPSYVEATLALGQLYESSHRKEKAQRLYQAFQEKFGPNASVAEDLARLYIEEKDYLRAFDQLAVIEAVDPSDVNVKSKMAFILIEQQRFREAIVRLEDVLSIEPGSDKIRFYLGAVYEEVKDYKQAVSHFQKVPTASSYYSESIVHASYLFKLMGDYAKALETIRGGIKQKDDHAPFYALYASLLDDQKQYSQAIEMLSVATKKFPDHAQLQFFLGNMHDRLGDRDATILSMKRVLEIEKDHVQALNFLAYTYAETGKHLDDAEKLARRALALQPEDGYILDTLGWVLFKKGKVPEAIQTLEAAYKIQPNESVIAEHLGDAYYHQQMPEKAKKLYLRAAENETNVTTLEKIRNKIGAVDRQSQALGTDDNARKPASTKAR